MQIIISNLVLISLLLAYKHFIDKNHVTDYYGSRKYGWKEYFVFFGTVCLFNSYTFIQDGLAAGIFAYLFLIIGFYSGAFRNN
tara:strand:- start:11 stop:259 length:249 start_codon:yes stop_codon:yes gene_type:complete